jgi:hypothetical protein
MGQQRWIGHRRYEILFGSDVQRDGVYLELSECTEQTRNVLAEVFFYDEIGRLVFTSFEPDIPYSLVKWLHDAVINEGWHIHTLGRSDRLQSAKSGPCETYQRLMPLLQMHLRRISHILLTVRSKTAKL